MAAPVTESRCIGVGVSRHTLLHFDTPAVLEVIRDAGRPEGVTADFSFNARLPCPPLYTIHQTSTRDKGESESRPVFLWPRGRAAPFYPPRCHYLDVLIQELLQAVMARHFIDLAVFLMEAQPAALSL